MGTCVSSASSSAESNARLIFHLTAIVLLLVMPLSNQVPVAALVAPTGCQRQQPLHRQRHWQTLTTRECQLFSSCSRRHVRITAEQVDAKGLEHDAAANLLLLATSDGRLRLQRRNSDLYICFNQSGHLVVKDTSYLTEWNDRCSFHECLSDNGFTELRSQANPDWLVGFNRFGEPLRGKRTVKSSLAAKGKDDEKLAVSKLTKCYQLLKRNCPPRPSRTVARTVPTAFPTVTSERQLASHRRTQLHISTAAAVPP